MLITALFVFGPPVALFYIFKSAMKDENNTPTDVLKLKF